MAASQQSENTEFDRLWSAIDKSNIAIDSLEQRLVRALPRPQLGPDADARAALVKASRELLLAYHEANDKQTDAAVDALADALEPFTPRDPGLKQHAPALDYRLAEFDGMTEPGVPEPCGCDESVALRAEVDKRQENVEWWSARAHEHAARLATATALLERTHRENIVWSGTGTTQLARDVDAFLSTTPAPSERTMYEVIDPRGNVVHASHNIEVAAADAQRMGPDHTWRLRSTPEQREIWRKASAPSERAAAHMAGCRYEREFPAIDPEDCPRCSEAKS